MNAFFKIFLSILMFFVFSFAHAEAHLQTLEKQLSDSVITTKLKAKFAKNPGLNPLKVFVSTKDGVVTLSGHVKNKQTFIEALRITKETNGVKGIEVGDLIIKQVNSALTDTYITAKVEAAVLTAKVLDDESIPLVGIQASTENGTVTLSGQVKQNKSVAAIIKRVNAVHGVKKIISQLQINQDA